VDLAARPRGETTVRLLGPAARVMEREVFEHDRCHLCSGPLHESLADPMQPLPHAVPFTSTLAVEQAASDATVVGLLPRQVPSPTEMRRLNVADATEGQPHETRLFSLCLDTVQGVLVRVEGDRRRGRVGLRRTFPDCHENPLGRHGQGAKYPRRI